MKNFFSLIKVAVGHSDRMPDCLTDEQWLELWEECKRQTLTGIFIDALERLPKDQCPSRKVLFKGAMAMKKMENNPSVNVDCNKLCGFFHNNGFYCTVLKGQGVSRYYPHPLHRVCGDIDIWVMPKGGEKMSVNERTEKVIRFAKSLSGNTKASYHHIDGPKIVKTEMEIHYRPSYMFAPWHNRRLQRYFGDRAYTEMRNVVCVNEVKFIATTDEFNVIFLLSHIYRHLFEEGIGLRQVMDYYWLLVKSKIATDSERNTIVQKQLRSLGLYNIASALMWILEDVFEMDRKYMIAEPNEKVGRFVLSEIIATGNFGHYDERVSDKMKNSSLGHNILRLKRDVLMMRFFSSECLCEPFFRIYHWAWRTFRLWRF